MKREFSYFEKDGQKFPIIEVVLQYQNRKLAIKALVDSGASFSVFSSEIAQYLGISVEKGKKIYLTGIGGRILGYLHALTLSLNEIQFNCKVIFTDEATTSLNLLGRDNFFEPFAICFFEKDKKISISSLKSR